MTKEEILDYVMNSPNNTNRMVLSGMIDSLNEYDAVITAEGGIVRDNTLIWTTGSYAKIFSMLDAGKIPRVLLDGMYLYGDVICGSIAEVFSFNKSDSYFDMVVYLNGSFYNIQASEDGMSIQKYIPAWN